MKPLHLKIILTIVVLLLGYLIIDVVFDRNLIHEAGEIELIIVDEHQEIVYHNILPYEKDQTFFDLLNQKFTLTCANRFYNPDSTCSYEFNIMGQSNYVILGIKSDTFEIMTDWSKTFIKIEVYDGEKFIQATQGFNHLDISNFEKIRLIVDAPR